jgi:hypothetical protein
MDLRAALRLSRTHSQSFIGLPKQEFNYDDWNAKVVAIRDMGDDSTQIGSCQEADGDAQRAPGDGDNGHIAVGGPEHPEEVLLNVMGEEDFNAEAETVAGQQVQHLSHFLFISAISYFFYLSHFLHCLNIRFFEALLATMLVMWGR